VFAALGTTQRRLGQWDVAIDNLQRALVLDPASRSYQGTMLETMYGNFRYQDVLDNTVPLEDADRNDADSQISRALAHFQLTGDLDPLGATLKYVNPTTSTLYLVHAPTYYLYKRDAQGVLAFLNGPAWTRAIENEFGWRAVYFELKSAALRLMGDTRAANEASEQLVASLAESEQLAPQDRFYGYLLVAGALARLGRAEEARTILGRAESLLENHPDALVMQVYFEQKAMILALLGDADQALSMLRQAMSTKGSNNPVTPLTLHYDPRWDFFRDNPEFAELSTPDLGVQEIKP
jgi:tetratricopeptide (TPR) repeat protein